MSNSKPTIKEYLVRLDERQKAMGDKLSDMADTSLRTAVATEKRLDHHSDRIRKVEGRQYWFSGAAAVVGAALGSFWDQFNK